MSRYIDAEKYPCKTCGISYCHENCKKFYEWLNGCDYDVENVVAELKQWTVTDVEIILPSSKEVISDNNIIASENAIEIVRKGGTE